MHDLKHTLRQHAYQLRNEQTDKQNVSQLICQRLIKLSVFQQAKYLMCYIHCRSEVRTLSILTDILAADKQCVIPYCTKDQQGKRVLGLWLFSDLAELVAGTWGILEPPRKCWAEVDRQVDPLSLDLIIVPGVAFTRDGARLGNGAGYYDRLLHTVGADTVLVGVAYETQLLPQIPMQAHDVYMDFVVTETAVYNGKGK